MIAPQKPCVLMSCGIFSQAICFDDSKQRLEAAGFDVVLVSTHPSLGPNSAGKTVWDDARALQEQMSPQISEGREFIIIGHSYGGYPGFVATQGWTVSERRAVGKKGGVRAVVFFTATVPTTAGMRPINVFGPEIAFPTFIDHAPMGGKVSIKTQKYNWIVKGLILCRTSCAISLTPVRTHSLTT
jgi:pimeloyl-ACP methyl ester carboxylesterase